MPFAVGEGSTEYSETLLVDDQLGLQGVPLLLAGVLALLSFFWALNRRLGSIHQDHRILHVTLE